MQGIILHFKHGQDNLRSCNDDRVHVVPMPGNGAILGKTTQLCLHHLLKVLLTTMMMVIGHGDDDNDDGGDDGDGGPQSSASITC